MLRVITIRTEVAKHAEGHIAADGFTQVFCGVHIPAAVIECGITDPKNPYVGKANATCPECISEFNNGRREGYRES